MKQHSLSQRVVITGMGLVTAIGQSVDDFWQSLMSGHSGVRQVSYNNEQWPIDNRKKVAHSFLAADVKGLCTSDLPGEISAAFLDPFAIFALHAAEQALQQAGKKSLLGCPEKVGIVMGTAVGGDHARNDATFRVYQKQRSPSPQTILKAMTNGAVSAISMGFGITGPATTIATACASGTHAIGQAYRMIQRGEADIVLAGGSESLPSYSLYRSWLQMRVLSPDGCRPFCHDRNGMVLGEGAGVLVLESLPSAIARKATILAEVNGFAMNADAGDWTRPSAERMADCIKAALDEASWHPQQVDYINAHGTGTQVNDQAEADAIQQVWQQHCGHVAISSTKAFHGHVLGATGAIESIALVKALQDNCLPANSNDPDACSHYPLDLIQGKPRPANCRRALNHSFAFGGLNGVLALSNYKEH